MMSVFHPCFFKFRVHFAKCDVTVKDDWVKLWDEAERALGGKVEILMNNAGVPPTVSRRCFAVVLVVELKPPASCH